MSAVPVLQTARLRLRAPEADAEALYRRFYTDAAASRAYGGPLSVGGAHTRLLADRGAWEVQGFGVWVLERRAERDLIGTCGFWQGPGWPRELTWWLLPEERGAGYALEASRAAVAHAYEVFGWPAVETTMSDANAAARSLVQRLGGEPIGQCRTPAGELQALYRIPRVAADH